jgi:hypothetical protein
MYVVGACMYGYFFAFGYAHVRVSTFTFVYIRLCMRVVTNGTLETTSTSSIQCTEACKFDIFTKMMFSLAVDLSGVTWYLAARCVELVQSKSNITRWSAKEESL